MIDFHTTSAFALAGMAEFFETSWPNADVDLLDDSLTILLFGNKQYLINKHGVTQQIWVSSPFTGAHHFAYQDGEWRCTRTDKLLDDFLRDEKALYAA